MRVSFFLQFLSPFSTGGASIAIPLALLCRSYRRACRLFMRNLLQITKRALGIPSLVRIPSLVPLSAEERFFEDNTFHQRRKRMKDACHLDALPDGLVKSDLLIIVFLCTKRRCGIQLVVAHIMICRSAHNGRRAKRPHILGNNSGNAKQRQWSHTNASQRSMPSEVPHLHFQLFQGGHARFMILRRLFVRLTVRKAGKLGGNNDVKVSV